MAWKLSGELVETCSCNMLCPCWYGVQELMVMDQGWCGGPMLIRVRDGAVDSVDLSGIDLVFGYFFPGPTLFDGNATGRVYVSAAATSDQVQRLEQIMHGARGGPMEIIGGLVSTWLSTRTVAIDIQATDGKVDAVVDGVGEIHSRRLKNEAGETMTMRNVGFAEVFGFADKQAELAPSTGTRWSDSDFPQPMESKSGAVGQFSWSGA